MINFASPVILDDCSLYAAGRNCAVMHAQNENCFKIVIVNRSGAVISVDGNNFPLNEGEGLIVFPHEIIDINSETVEDFTCNYIVFSVDTARYNDAFGQIKFSVTGKNMRVFNDEHINNALVSVCTELESGVDAYSEELISLLCSQMLVYLLRCFGNNSLSESVSNDANLKVCSMVMSYIDNHIYTMKSLSEVASEMGYNYSYISTLFRKTCGMTLNSYFKTKRMNEAKKLLQNKKMSVSEIARVMNYSSVYAFSKAFKEYFGASPGHYSGRYPSVD